MSDDTTWAEADDIVAQWRTLKPAEAERAPGLIAMVERHIARTWRDVPARIDSGSLPLADVVDVVVWLVIPMLAPGTEMPPSVKSWQETAGSESKSVTLDTSSGSTMLVFAGWMVDVFEGRDRSAAAPVYGAMPSFGGPASGGYEALFPAWPERGHRGSAR